MLKYAGMPFEGMPSNMVSVKKNNGDLICVKRLQIKLQIDGNASPD